MNGNIMGIIETVLYFGFFMGVIYFLWIRPQKKKQNEAKRIREELKVGNIVVSIGGIRGSVTRIEEDFIELETGNSNLVLMKWAIGTVENHEVPENIEVDDIETVEK